MKTIQTTILLIGLSCIGHAHAAPPAAIIEDINAPKSGLAFMDYLSTGQIIKLDAKDSITLGYLQSCRRETITGGTVTIGTEQSSVSKSQLMREDVECDGGHAELSGQSKSTSAALAFRSGSKKVGLRQPEVTIYGNSPIFRLAQANAELSVERIDVKGKRYKMLLKSKHVDFSDKNISLAPGIYRAQITDGKSKIFKVHNKAEPGKAPIISRLVDL